jgi:photosystem II stability/assembly factor-like uncharacterized protein
MHARSLPVASALALALAAAPALAGPWQPVGIADAVDSLVATHPITPGVAVVQSGRVYAGFGTFVAGPTTYLTLDGGTTWAANARPRVGGRPSLSGTSVVYLDDGGGTIGRSNDAGRSFFPIALPPTTGGSYASFAGANPANPEELVAWSGAVVSRSLDGGATWVAEPPAPGAIQTLVVDWSARRLYARFGTQPIGHRALDGPSAWGLGGPGSVSYVNAERGVAVVQTSADLALHRSVDGGMTYSLAVVPPDIRPVCAVGFGSVSSQRIYALECLSFANGARVLRSSDAGATWTYAGGVVSIDLEVQASIAVDAGDPQRLYVATRNGVLASSDGGATLAPMPRTTNAPGSLRTLILDQVNAASQWLGGDPRGFFRSSDGGTSWSFFVNDQWRPIVASRLRASTLFAVFRGAGQVLGLSTDGGASFVTKVGPGGKGSSIDAVGFGVAPGSVFVAAFGPPRKLFYSSDDGESFSERFAPPLATRVIVAATGTPNALYAGGAPESHGGPQLYRSLDAAITWSPVATFPAPLSGFGGASATRSPPSPSTPPRRRVFMPGSTIPIT